MTRTEQLTALAEAALEMYANSDLTLEMACVKLATEEIAWRSIRDRAFDLCDTDGMERAERAMGC